MESLPFKLKNKILDVTNSKSISSIAQVQKLWSGYGSLLRFFLNDGDHKSVIVKYIDLSTTKQHPKGWNSKTSHQRKVNSYKVEINFYKNYNFLRNINSYFPKYIYSEFNEDKIIIILEDLGDLGFTKVVNNPNDNEINLCLKWLAEFHSRAFNTQNNGIWKIGSYWHLDTRQDEFKKMASSKLKELASKINTKLNSAKFKTIIHGDAKTANFCFTKDSSKVAAVDFQYVGYGSPVKDLIYFLGSALDENELFHNFHNYKDLYYSHLEQSVNDLDFKSLKLEIEELWKFAFADFERFLLGWMPEHKKLTKFSNIITQEVINLIS
jgi:hypothetical protein